MVSKQIKLIFHYILLIFVTLVGFALIPIIAQQVSESIVGLVDATDNTARANNYHNKEAFCKSKGYDGSDARNLFKSTFNCYDDLGVQEFSVKSVIKWLDENGR